MICKKILKCIYDEINLLSLDFFKSDYISELKDQMSVTLNKK